MLDLMERTNVRVGRGSPMGDDGIWLSGPRDVEPEETDRVLSTDLSFAVSIVLFSLTAARVGPGGCFVGLVEGSLLSLWTRTDRIYLHDSSASHQLCGISSLTATGSS